jgi:hypothetical protein
VHIEEVDLEAVPRKEARDRLSRAAVSLSSVREKLGGDLGAIADEFGDLHPLTLAEWSHREPGTRLTIYFTYQQDNLPEGFRGSIYPMDVLTLLRAPTDSS